MKNTNNVQGLVKHLEQEINWIEQLNTILSEEKIALSKRQFDTLEDFAEKKQELTTMLEDSAKQRADLFRDSNETHSLSLSNFLKDCPPEDANNISQLNNTLAEKLSLCRELNTVNGQVIAHNIYTRQEIVNVLTGNTAEAISVYTASGDVTSTTNTNHHEEA